jgi:hypothetical protein
MPLFRRLWSKFGTLSEIDVFEAKSRPEVTRPLACVFTGAPDTIRTVDTRFRRETGRARTFAKIEKRLFRTVPVHQRR